MTLDVTGLVGLSRFICFYIKHHQGCTASDVVAWIQCLFRKDLFNEYEIRQHIQQLVESRFLRYGDGWRLYT